jgi:uncharacterized membrane protein
MTSLRNNRSPLAIATIALGAVYPFVVYLCLDRLPPGVFVLMALAIVAARIAVARRSAWAKSVTISLGVAGILLALIDQTLASRAYPVLMGLSAAAVFGHSLLYPPTVIEQFAGREAASSPEAIQYLRKLTVVWLVFLLVNAAVSAATAIIGDVALWTLYNGFIAYMLTGALFVGEMLVRPRPAPRSAA